MRIALTLLLLLLFTTDALAQVMLPDSPRPRQEEAQRTAERWLDMMEAGDAAGSFAMLHEVFRANHTADTWRESVELTRTELGPRISRNLRRIVWHQDPPNGPLPGTYAVAEFDSVYTHASRHFQHVVLHSASGEPFLILRNEATITFNEAPPEETP